MCEDLRVPHRCIKDRCVCVVCVMMKRRECVCLEKGDVREY